MPSIPWSGDGLTAELTAEGTIPEEVFNKAMVTTVEEVRDTWHSGSRNKRSAKLSAAVACSCV